jgi:hypothetical protein
MNQNIIVTSQYLAANYTYEELAAALYAKGVCDGYPKVTDKTKWREPVMAERLGHVAHAKISAGQNSDEYGSDAYDAVNNVFAEYKSNAIDDSKLRNLLGYTYGKGRKYAPLKVTGVYNGAYKDSALEAYANIDHYFGVFYQEECVLIIKPHRAEVMRQLTYNNSKRKPGATTNLNNVEINLGDTSIYEVAYRKESFFDRFTQ